MARRPRFFALHGLASFSPFLAQAGKALEKRLTEIRIQLHPIAQPYFAKEELAENELVILVRRKGQRLALSLRSLREASETRPFSFGEVFCRSSPTKPFT